MVYSVYEIDYTNGQVITDQTRRLTVMSEHSWSEEIIANATKSEEIGSRREFKEGVLTTLGADGERRSNFNVGDRDLIVPISFELNPRLFGEITGAPPEDGSWHDAPASAAGRIAKSREYETPCRPPMQTDVNYPPCPEAKSYVHVVQRVEFDANSVSRATGGAIAVASETLVDGMLARTFVAHFVRLVDP